MDILGLIQFRFIYIFIWKPLEFDYCAGQNTWIATGFIQEAEIVHEQKWKPSSLLVPAHFWALPKRNSSLCAKMMWKQTAEEMPTLWPSWSCFVFRQTHAALLWNLRALWPLFPGYRTAQEVKFLTIFVGEYRSRSIGVIEDFMVCHF